MDVYHKVLAKLYEMTGGRDSVDVDLAELLKKEGFFPSLDNISTHLLGESWVTETARQHTVRITHWGVAEAKRTLSNSPDKNKALTKEANRLLASTREMQIMLEEFVESPDSDKFKVIEQRMSEMTAAAGKIRSNL